MDQPMRLPSTPLKIRIAKQKQKLAQELKQE
jgi:hypothetical protein